jgi:hypothetical protein
MGFMEEESLLYVHIFDVGSPYRHQHNGHSPYHQRDRQRARKQYWQRVPIQSVP